MSFLTSSKKYTDSPFSNSIRDAKSKERKRVYDAVLEKAIADQNQIIKTAADAE